MELNLNLATRPYVDIDILIKRFRMAIVVIGLLIVIIGVMLYFAHVAQNSYRADLQVLDNSIAANLRELSGYRQLMQRPEAILLAERTNALNQLFDDKAFSWTLLMRDLEGMVPPDVQLSSIQPERAKDGTLILHLHVVGPRAASIEFLHNLESSNSFEPLRILGESVQDDPRSTQHTAVFSEVSTEEFNLIVGYTVSDLHAKQPASASGQEASKCASCSRLPVPVVSTVSGESLPQPVKSARTK
jgi:type IV pilus assembly protein PilN